MRKEFIKFLSTKFSFNSLKSSQNSEIRNNCLTGKLQRKYTFLSLLAESEQQNLKRSKSLVRLGFHVTEIKILPDNNCRSFFFKFPS